MKRKIYLAYGSNMSLQQMYHRCPDAEPIGKGILKGWRLMFKGSQSGNYATIEKEEGFYVKETVVFEYIGDRPGRRTKGEGMVYVMPSEKSTLGLPSERYYDVLLEGYHRFGFDVEILDEAMDFSS